MICGYVLLWFHIIGLLRRAFVFVIELAQAGHVLPLRLQQLHNHLLPPTWKHSTATPKAALIHLLSSFVNNSLSALTLPLIGLFQFSRNRFKLYKIKVQPYPRESRGEAPLLPRDQSQPVEPSHTRAPLDNLRCHLKNTHTKDGWDRHIGMVGLDGSVE